MPNLILTYQCHNHCEFCFVEAPNDSPQLSLSAVKTLLPFLRSFGRDTLHLLGGEPTLNPAFLPILQCLLGEGFQVKIFTNGHLSPDLVHQLQCLPDEDFHFCVNRTNRRLTPAIINFYQKLGYRVQLGVTFFQINQSAEHIYREILEYRLRPEFRVGIALPIWPHFQNAYLHPDEYDQVAGQIFRLFTQVIPLGLRPEFDCGFPDCFFSDEQKNFLEANNIEFHSNCGIIPDLRPDLTAIPCFPLARFAVPVSSSSRWNLLRQQLTQQWQALQFKSLFMKCQDCEAFYTGRCCGGCAALRLTEPEI